MIQIDMSIINEKHFPYLSSLITEELEKLHEICVVAITFGPPVNVRYTAKTLGLPDCLVVEIAKFLDRFGVPRRRRKPKSLGHKIPRIHQDPTPPRFEPAPGETAKLHTVVFASAMGTNEV